MNKGGRILFTRIKVFDTLVGTLAEKLQQKSTCFENNLRKVELIYTCTYLQISVDNRDIHEEARRAHC
jgi:hypothetical protein